MIFRGYHINNLSGGSSICMAYGQLSYCKLRMRNCSCVNVASAIWEVILTFCPQNCFWHAASTSNGERLHRSMWPWRRRAQTYMRPKGEFILYHLAYYTQHQTLILVPCLLLCFSSATLWRPAMSLTLNNFSFMFIGTGRKIIARLQVNMAPEKTIE